MCFNANTSLFTFAISLVCFCYLLNRGINTDNKNDIFLSVLTILIGMMQLVEFFLWRNQTCNRTNHYLSLFIILSLFLQGTISNICYFKLYPDASIISNQFANATIFVYLMVVVYTLFHLNTYELCSKPSKHSCRLVWDSIAKLNYPENYLLYMLNFSLFFSMFAMIAINSIYSKNDLLTKYPFRYSFIFLTFALSFMYVLITTYYYKEIYAAVRHFNIPDLFKQMMFLGSSDVFGSVWCFLSVFVGVVGIFEI